MYAEGRDFHYQEIDLDGDGVMEYLFREERPMKIDFRHGFVYKLVDGELALCFICRLDELGMESLYYEGDYYLYMGNLLIRCGEGCDLLARRYDEEEMNRATYIPGPYSIENSYLDYIVAVVEKGDYTWHEGYRSEGYEGIDFQSYLPDGLENQLPQLGVRGQYWFFERTDTSAGGSFQELCHYLPVEVEGRECIYLFLPKQRGAVTADVIVAVLVPESDEKYTIACMYSLNHANEYFLIDKSQYTDDLVTNDYIAYYCLGDNPRVQNDSYDEMIEQYHPIESALWFWCVYDEKITFNGENHSINYAIETYGDNSNLCAMFIATQLVVNSSGYGARGCGRMFLPENEVYFEDNIIYLNYYENSELISVTDREIPKGMDARMELFYSNIGYFMNILENK